MVRVVPWCLETAFFLFSYGPCLARSIWSFVGLGFSGSNDLRGLRAKWKLKGGTSDEKGKLTVP